jgi:ubiquinone/menaquinone biosynthesis C-methylase UbiE
VTEASNDWRTYDAIAGDYAVVAEPAYFREPAADLVALLRIQPGMHVADIGTGSGAVAAAAAEAVAPGGFVVGIDPSLSMLSAGRRRLAGAHLVAAALPSLPCDRGRMDAAIAAFVLTHVADLDAALASMIEMVKPGGVIGVSAWERSPAATPPGALWQTTAERYVPTNALTHAMESALPGEKPFATLEGLRATLAHAGLADVRVEERAYEVQLSTESFIASRLISLSSRFMRTNLSASAWEGFRHDVSKRLHDSFGARLKFTVSVNLGAGTRAT